MAEHFRDFRDPQIDTLAEPILEPEADAVHRFLVRRGPSILKILGAEPAGNHSGSQLWRFNSRDNTAVMKIHEPDIVIPAILRHRDLGLFYTYTGDDQPLWTTVPGMTSQPESVDSGNPTPDSLVVLAETLHQSTQPLRRLGYMAARALAPVKDRLARRAWSVSTDRTKSEIAAHYDLSQDVYTGPHGFLDERFVQYSSGLLPAGRDFTSLEDLQEQKVASLIEQLELDKAETLLEVGGGWGGLAVAMAQAAPNLHITSLTVSDEQLKRARQRAEAAGVADRIEFLGVDYRDLAVEKPFDRVVSVEMIEAVDWRDLDTYFDSLVKFVDPTDGIIVLQSINVKPEGVAQQRHNKSFANRAIFPGGFLTSLEEIRDSLAQRDWYTHRATELTASYQLTLREWIRNLYAKKADLTQKWLKEGIPAAKSERFYRGFSFYLAFSQAGFRVETDHLQDWQLAFKPSK